MTLRTALVIDGSAEGAKKAAQETAVAIKDVGKAATEASKDTAAVTANLEKAGTGAKTAAAGLKDVGPAARDAGGELETLAKRADDLAPRFNAARTALIGFAGGIAGGVVVGAAQGVIEGAIGALGNYAANAISKTDEIDAALKSHIALIKDIKGAYSDAEEGVSSYGNNSVALLRYRAQQDETQLQQSYRDALPTGGLFNVGVFASGSGGFSDAQLGPYAEAVRTFRKEIAEGTSDVIAFNNEIAKIAAEQPRGSQARTLADSILGDTKDAAEALEKLRRAQDVLKGIEGDSNAAARALGGSAEKYDQLGAAAGTAAGQISPAAQAITQSGNAAATAASQIEAYKRSLSGVGGAGGIPAVSSSSARGAASSDRTITPITPFAPTPFAMGGVVNEPTLFGYGNGQQGLMGEAGAEAIMPLKGGAVGALTSGGRETRLNLTRLSDGSLGVELPRAFAYGGVVSGFRAGGTSMSGGGVRGGYGRQGGYGDDTGDMWGGVYSALADGLRGVVSGVFEAARSGDFSDFWERFAEIGLSVSERLFNQMLDQAIDGLLSSIAGGGGFGGGSGTGSGAGSGGGIGGLIGSFFGGGSASYFPPRPGGLFDKGGWTGSGPHDEIGGVVHREEFVVRAPIVRQPGVRAMLEALNDGRMASGLGRGFRDGGHGSGTSLGNVVSFRQTERGPPIINNYAGVQVDYEERDDGRGGRQDVFTLADMVGQAIGTKGGGADRTLQRRYGVKPRGVVR